MPTETKNSTAKASRSGSDSCAARWLSSDSLRIMPAKKAPSANDTSNSMLAPKATPSAIASTDSRNSSREPVVRHGVQQPGDHALADHQHDRDEGRDLAEREQHRHDQRACARARDCP